MMSTFKTFGLTHIALAVKDVKRSIAFYQAVFDVRVMHQHEGWAQVQTPGTKDIIVFEEAPELAGKQGGIMHFGFRLKHPQDIDKVREAVEKANAPVREQGEFEPGEPYIFFYDPDGYEIEVWCELEG